MSISERSPSRTRLVAMALVLSVFAAGAVTGAAIYRWARLEDDHFGARPLPPPDMLRELNLSDEQRVQVQAIFEQYRPKLDAVLRETFPKVRKVQDEVDADIAKLLNASQKKALDAHRARRNMPGREGPPIGPHHGPREPLGGPGGPPPEHLPEMMPPPPEFAAPPLLGPSSNPATSAP